nr:hypothetical protein [Tanacetum cinerariifolium]
MVDFIAASPLRYALTVKPTIFISHIRQFWSSARIETTDEGTHILATVDGIQRTVSEASKAYFSKGSILPSVEMRIEQYFLMPDYSLWEVILNGDSPVPAQIIEGVVQPVAPTTAEQKLVRKNELKAHEKCFGGNTETKKVQKTLLKQQFENFSGSSFEGLDQIHDRLQKLVSQLEINGVSLSQEDVNLKKGHFARECRSPKDSRRTAVAEP